MGDVYGTAEGAYQSIMHTASRSEQIRVRARVTKIDLMRSFSAVMLYGRFACPG